MIQRSFNWKRWLIGGGAACVVFVVAGLASGSGQETGLKISDITRDDALEKVIGQVAAVHGYESYREMSFAEIEATAVGVGYTELVKNFSQYNLSEWVERGEPRDSVPPVLHFRGELIRIVDPETDVTYPDPRAWQGLWLGQLQLEDGNTIILNAEDPAYSVGDTIEAVAVCKDPFDNSSLPECITYRIAKVD